MGVHRFYGKSIRMNGTTDGLVVPTGAFKERGVKKNRPAYSFSPTTEYSNSTRTGREHIPNETNPLNTLRGAFTIDAYVVPDMGGMVVSKDGQFSLQVGNPFGVYDPVNGTQAGPISFTIISGGNSFTVETSFSIDTFLPSTMHKYGDNRLKPQDYTFNKQPLMMVTAQFDTHGLKLFMNTALVAELSFGGDSRLMDQKSSDLFIGGKGGEYRGLIESIRISRGTVAPKLEPLTNIDECIGFWDFNDDIEIPDVKFFSNSKSGSATQGRDGPGTDDGMFDIPLVMIGYDFKTIGVAGNPSGLGTFRVRELPRNLSTTEDIYSATEKLASLFTGIPLEEIREQSWYVGGNLLFSSETTVTGGQSNSNVFDYLDPAGSLQGIPQSNLNLIINHSGTHPDTKYHKGSTGSLRMPYMDPTTTPSSELYLVERVLAKGVDTDLDPMTNPTERVRVIGIDFTQNVVLCVSTHAASDETANGSSGIGGVENRPGFSSFKYHHDDDTPVWICLGNGDLVFDDGEKKTDLVTNPGQKTRPKDAYTRAVFSQGQRFKDVSGNKNEAFWVSIQSRSPKVIPSHLNQPQMWMSAGDTNYNPAGQDPPKKNLIFWHNAAHKLYYSGVFCRHFKDLSGNKMDFFGDTNGGDWAWESSNTLFNGQPCYKVQGSSVNGKVLVNGGSSTTNKLTTSPTDSYTIFMMINPVYDITSNLRVFSVQGGTNLTSLDYLLPTNSRTFSNASAGVIPPALPIPSANQTQLLCIRISGTGVTSKVEEWTHGVKLDNQISDGSIATAVDFHDQIFSLLGNASAVDPATGLATTSNFGAVTDFRIAEWMIYDKALSDTEMVEVNAYFLEKYGVI